MTADLPSLLPVLGGLMAGAALGAAYVRLLTLNVALYAGEGSWRRGLVLHAGRLAMIGGGMWGAAQWGAAVLLAALGGFLAARTLMVRKGAP